MLIPKISLVAVIAIPFLCASGAAQDANAQNWYGVLDAGTAKLRIQVVLKQDNQGNYSGQLISLDQSQLAMPCDEVKLNDNSLTFSVKRIKVKFSGKLNDVKTEATGLFEQSGAKIPFKLTKVDKVPHRDHIQTWTGKLLAAPMEFDFQFRIYRDDNGEYSALLDSFTENITGVACTLQRKDDRISIKVPIASAPATYTGTLSADNKRIDGTWEQRGHKTPLVLKAVPLSATRKVEQKRPQTPKPPFDYDSDDVNVANQKDNVTLAGTLTSPTGDGPFPVVVLISGSGPQDRDETIFGHKIFFVIADYLTKNGIAVMRYDDRGTAESTGSFSDATSADFANDAEAVVDFLKSHKKVDPERIVLCGHSEGGIIAPMVASRRDDLAGIVLMAGPGVNGRRIAISQSRRMARVAGASEQIIELQDTMLRGILDQKDKGGPFDDEFLDRLSTKMKQSLPNDLRDSLDTRTMISATLPRIDTLWFEFFASYDPVPALKHTRCPVLAIVGEKDTQVDPKLNIPVIEQALKDGGNPDFELHILADLNHLFQTCKTGSFSEYGQIEETISPVALDLISSWLEQRVK